ncbi:hypothetical protein OC835_000790 [Tilletia horrida]|nr:hypothetical protein OC835_000790 [Tilletia horrida]
MPLSFGLSARSASSSKMKVRQGGPQHKGKAKPKAKSKAKGKSKAKLTSKSKGKRRARSRPTFSNSDTSSDANSDASHDDHALSDDFSDSGSESTDSDVYESDVSEGLVGDPEIVAMLRDGRKTERAAVRHKAKADRKEARRQADTHRASGPDVVNFSASDDDMEEDQVVQPRPALHTPSSTARSGSSKGRGTLSGAALHTPKAPKGDTTAAGRMAPSQPSRPRSVLSVCEQLFEVAVIRDSVRANPVTDSWHMDMFDHVFTLLGSIMASMGVMHSEVRFLLQALYTTQPSPSQFPSTPAASAEAALSAALSRPVFADSVDEYNRLTGRAVSKAVLWTDGEARTKMAEETGVTSPVLPFAYIVRDEYGEPVCAERLKTIRALIREAVAVLEALPDKRVPNGNGVLPTRCRSYFQTYHRFSFLQAIRTIETNAPEMALCKGHYKALNGIDRRLKSLITKDTREVVDLTKAEDEDGQETGEPTLKTPSAARSATASTRRPTPRPVTKKSSSTAAAVGAEILGAYPRATQTALVPLTSTASTAASAASSFTAVEAASSAQVPAMDHVSVGRQATFPTSTLNTDTVPMSRRVETADTSRRPMPFHSAVAPRRDGPSTGGLQLPSFDSMFSAPSPTMHPFSQTQTGPSSSLYSTSYPYIPPPPPAPGFQ